MCTSYLIEDLPRHELGKSMSTTACNFEKSAQNDLSYLTVYTTIPISASVTVISDSYNKHSQFAFCSSPSAVNHLIALSAKM